MNHWYQNIIVKVYSYDISEFQSLESTAFEFPVDIIQLGFQLRHKARIG